MKIRGGLRVRIALLVSVWLAAPAESAGFERREVRFPCGEVRCAGWLFLPDGVPRPPLVSMAHGFGGTRHRQLPRHAARFAANGLASLVFDHRHLGDSEGEPRQLIDPEAQLADWRSALAYARTLDAIDGERMARGAPRSAAAT